MRIDINSEERDELLRVLRHAVSDARVEIRRTRTHDFEDALIHEKDVLVGLVEKLEQSE